MKPLANDVLMRRLRKRMMTTPYPYQMRGIKFLEQHEGRVLIADEMGLGKSLQAIAWVAAHKDLHPVVVVCPATVKYNWQREWAQHTGIKSVVLDGMIPDESESREKIREKARSLRKSGEHRWVVRRKVVALKKRIKSKRQETKGKVSEALKADVLIINYDILDSWLQVLVDQVRPRVMIIDECHLVKNRKARRTKACKELSRRIPHVIALSGTPITAKPVEFFPVLQMVRPREFQSWWKYCFAYCNPKRNHWSGGWDFSGASNLDALRKRLKGIMIRRLKRKVLKDLPPKTRTVIPVDIDNREEYQEAERDFLRWLLRRKGRDAWDRASRAEAICRINSLKQLTAHGKLGVVTQWIKEWLESTDEKIVVFAVHRAVIAHIKKAFPCCNVIDGSTSARERQRIVDDFQGRPISPKERIRGDGILVGQMRAAGVGINLTKASNVVFLELGWAPGEHDQAEDRCYRIGTKNKVSVYYFVGKKTIEERILEIIHTKDETVGRILDGRKGGVMKLLNLFMRRAKHETV